MNKMEELKFIVNLDWRIRFEKFEYIFSDALFLKEFAEFLGTETGKKWLTKESGLKYLKWQEK